MKRWMIAVAAACLMLVLSPLIRAADRPNVIYIVADDLGYADIGAQGISKDVKTPNIDAIAAEGVRFTNGYVSCPVCSPTRAGLMTGRYQQRFGFETNPGPAAETTFGLPMDQATLPQTLKEAGYATGAVGKWHLGSKPEMVPTKRGFDEFYGFLGGAHGYNTAGGGRNVLMRNDQPAPFTEYLTDAFAKEASAFIDRHAGALAKGDAGAKPFFLYLAFNAVHTPMESPAKYEERFADVTDPKRKTMLAMLSAMDDAVGQVLAAVAKHGQEKNTLVIFHADNGGPTPANGSRNTPLRGTKGTVYEGGVRVPFFVKWPAKLPAGKTYDKPVIALDLFPTIAAATGAALPQDVKLDGVDLLPHLAAAGSATDPTANPLPPHEQLYWRFGAGRWAVRDGDFKLVHADENSPAQLFNLASDAGEQKDLSAEMPDKAKALQARFDEWSAQMQEPRWQPGRDAKAGGKGKGKGKKGKNRDAQAE